MDKRRLIISLFLIVSVIVIYACVSVYNLVYKPVTDHEQYLFIPTGSKLADVENMLVSNGILRDKSKFDYLAKWKKYNRHVHAGKYKIVKGMSLNRVINLLRAGMQTPVVFVLDNIRTKHELIKEVSSQLEADTASLHMLLNDPVYLARYGLNKDNALALFIPDKYQLYWNTSASQFIGRMYKVNRAFWNNARLQKAKSMNMTTADLVILASVVQMESTKADEMPVIAGVYYNRLKKGIPLQADPTVIYALGDFNIKRLFNAQLNIDSPYNTYKYKGLPPGPICLPNALTIDKVLNYDHNDYLFFCARGDLSGYHNFAKTSAEHAQNAMKYRNALDQLDIKF